MSVPRKCWLFVNPRSGSNREAAVREISECLESNGIEIERLVEFPDETLPAITEFEQAGNPLAVIFTGDGSANAIIDYLSGWSGAVLILPGGTMNLLAHRMHGDASCQQIIEAVARGGATRSRIEVARCAQGVALCGLLVGPGTRWAQVRESMREIDLPAIAESTVSAMEDTASGPRVVAHDPALGSREGYPLIEITPGEHGMQLDGFYAESAVDYARQGWALLRRSFRDGPHDRLGLVRQIRLGSVDGSRMGLLLDGEPVTAEAEIEITVAKLPVDLLATANGS